MNTEHFIHNLRKRGNIQSNVGLPAASEEISEAELRLGVTFPDQVKWFYRACNGLKTFEPALKVLPLAELKIDPESQIEFAVIDNLHALCFDASHVNETGQWDIVNPESSFLVTKTMASFWSNKIFAWLDKHRTIWQEEAC